jgi:hypothetical protein
MTIAFSKFDIELHQAGKGVFAVAEADIRSAHGEDVSRPTLSGVPEYLYDALVHSCDEDQKAYDQELDAQYRVAHVSDELLDGDQGTFLAVRLATVVSVTPNATVLRCGGTERWLRS